MKQQKAFLLILSVAVISVGCGNPGSDENSDSENSTSGDKETDSENSTSGDGESDSETDTATEPPPSTDSETPTDTESLTCFMTEECGASVPFERIICPYPLTPTMDGELDDDAWQSASWEFVDYTHGSVPSDNDIDASMEFACVADADYIYFAYRVRDDVVYSGENTACDVWKDDSIEFYIDECYERAPSYDGNEAQITVGAENIGVTEQSDIVFGGCGGPFQGPDTQSISYSVTMDGGWMGELAVPLKPEGGWSIDRADGQIIGFNAHYNDDDDGGERDHKLIWSAKDMEYDLSWTDPEKFGELQFCNINGSDDADAGTNDAGTNDAGQDSTADAGSSK
jgi:hypothetical protein